MPRAIGFSTGSLAASDYAAALHALEGTDARAVELSALREVELEPLMRDLATLDLRQYSYVAVHAPSSTACLSEEDIVALLSPAVDARLPIIVHADIIQSPRRWKKLDKLLLIENMDKRKRTGRTTEELRPLFEQLPHARFCLDFAHARQIDPSLSEVIAMLFEFGGRLAQLHLSELNTESKHESLSYAAVSALKSVQSLLPIESAIILEYRAEPHELSAHIELVRTLLHSPLAHFSRASSSL